MSEVFLSHSAEDRIKAGQLAEALRKRGFSVFMDADSIAPGADYADAISDAISRSDAVILLLSKATQRSKWVKSEIEAALESKKRVLPLLLDSEAKNNWIWPLVADRHAFHLDDKSLEEVALQFSESMSNRGLGASEPSMPIEASAPSSSLSLVIVGIVALVVGIVGTLIVVNAFQ